MTSATLKRLEVDLATLVALAVLAASIVAVLVNAATGTSSLGPLTQADLAYIGAGAAVVLIVGRMLISALANKGISAATGIVQEVEVWISTYVGYGLTAATWLAAAISAVQGDAHVLGLTNGELTKIGLVVAGVTTAGRLIQSALQDYGFAESQAVSGGARVSLKIKGSITSPDLAAALAAATPDDPPSPDHRWISREELRAWQEHVLEMGRKVADG